jgi:uncharacterized protein YbjT (DUF2867 family)/membrane protease YdiL (CAAX protease family)
VTSSAGPKGIVLLTGAAGFVGRHAYEALTRDGWAVRCATRNVEAARGRWPEREWVSLNAADPASVERALEGCQAALYLIHGMATHAGDFRRAEVRQAEIFAGAAAAEGLQRIIYLGGVAAPRDASEHLRSREEVGEVLRSGPVPTIELRASMIVGHGSLSWMMVRDLAARLPFMILPKWLESRTEPVSIDDVLVALVGALNLETSRSEWFDIPGPEIVSGREILERTADALGVRRAPMIQVPFLSPKLSSHWVRFVTRADWAVAREVVVGLKTDLVAHDDRFWSRIHHPRRKSFDESARAALVAELREEPIPGVWGFIERRRRRTEGGGRVLLFVALWALGAFVARYVGLWTGLGTTALILGVAALLLEGRQLAGGGSHASTLPIGLLAGIGMALATTGLFDPVTSVLPDLRDDLGRLYEEFRVPGTLGLFLVPVMTILEEVVWRGAVHNELAQRFSWRGAVVVGTALYALAHVPVGSLVLVLASLGAGLCWSLLRALTDSLVPSVAAHFVWSLWILVLFQLG